MRLRRSGEGTVVLFNHPGGEHRVRSGPQVFAWNVGDHKRKYLAVHAHVAVNAGGGFVREHVARKVALWGEFEPATRAHAFDKAARPGEPYSWHELVPVGIPPAGAQNTDPWILGDAFRYGLCRQNSVEYLRSLQSGDLLLFGSYLKQDMDGRPSRLFNFFLDTVLVVRGGFPLPDARRIPSELLDPVYRRACYNRFKDDEKGVCTFYEGVMLSASPSAEPFSFSPCVPWERGSEPARMRRPMIGHLFGKSFGNGQVFARVEDRSPAEAWRLVVDECLRRGLSLAVRLDEPGLEPGTSDAGVSAGACSRSSDSRL